MKKSIIALLHIGYWFLYLMLLTFILLCLNIGTEIRQEPFLDHSKFELFIAAIAIVPAVFGFYMFYTVLFTQFLTPKRIPLLFLSGILTALVGGMLGGMALAILHSQQIGPGIFSDGMNSATSIVIFIAFIALMNGGMGLLTRGFIRWYDELKLKEDLTRQNFETELALVKSQIEPHFLFNTLHNIDALITKDPQKASNYLNKLSDILRFMLYETKPESIPLSNEIAYIEKYIELQKIRTANPDYVTYDFFKAIGHATIAPMIFIHFVENAFKHGHKMSKGNGIHVSISVEGTTIRFECTNRIATDNLQKPQPGGMGNDLVKKRLALRYPNRHQLTIEETADIYAVKLIIEQDEN